MNNKKRSIQNKITSYLVGAQVIFVVTIFVIVSFISVYGERKRYKEYNSIIVESKRVEIDVFLKNIINSAGLVLMNDDIWNSIILSDDATIDAMTPFYDNLEMYISNFYYGNKGIEYVNIYFPYQEKLFTKAKQTTESLSISSKSIQRDSMLNSSWYKSAVENVGEYTMGSEEDGNLSISIALKNPYSKKISHVLNFAINREYISKILSHSLTEPESILMFTEDNTFSSSVNQEEDKIIDYIQNDLTGSNLLSNNFTIKTQARYYCVYQVSDEYSYIIAKVIPVNRIYNLSFLSMLLFLLLSAILTMVLLHFTRKNINGIIDPILRLANRMKKADEENLILDISYTEDDEVGELYTRYHELMERINYYINTTRKMEILNKQMQIEAIQRQVNPHFVYNVLQLLSNISIEKGDKDMEEICDSFGMLLRYNMANENTIVVLKEELNAAQKYLYLIQKRHKDRLKVEIYSEEECGDCIIIPFIIQPLLENSLKHGLKNKPGKWEIKLEITKEDEFVVISIWDNGIGMKKKVLEIINSNQNIQIGSDIVGGKGLGLVISRIYSYYEGEAKVTAKSYFNMGTEILLKIPFKK